MGDVMTEHQRTMRNQRTAAAVAALALMTLAASFAGAADRMVLGEYFTEVG
jgi:hypothetical protein